MSTVYLSNTSEQIEIKADAAVTSVINTMFQEQALSIIIICKNLDEEDDYFTISLALDKEDASLLRDKLTRFLS